MVEELCGELGGDSILGTAFDLESGPRADEIMDANVAGKRKFDMLHNDVVSSQDLKTVTMRRLLFLHRRPVSLKLESS
jgi:hypothetical protein